MDVIIRSVETIQAVVEELGKLTTFKTATYYNETQIIDIESRLRKKLSEITREVPSGQ